MEKMTRDGFLRRKRRGILKKIMLYGFPVIAILSIFMNIFVLYKTEKLKQNMDYALSGLKYGNNIIHPEKQALLKNPDAESNDFKNSVKTVLGDADIDKDTNELMQTKNETKRVYLTFDDGPSEYTGEILDILAANNVKASFFVIGKDKSYYQYYKRIVEEGHTIGMHSYSHVYKDFYASEEAFAEELTKLNDLIYNLTGVKSHIFRFPGGSSNSVSPLPIENYISYLNEHDIQYYDWNALNGDAVTSGLSPEQLVNNIMNDVEKHDDSIVLMHDLKTTHTTVESLQLLIDTLKSEGYEILPIDENTPLIQHVSSKLDEE